MQFTHDPKPLTEIERAFARAKHAQVKAEIVAADASLSRCTGQLETTTPYYLVRRDTDVLLKEQRRAAYFRPGRS